ncbi:hypothetical protein H5410_020552, partial [Solanum commersonii]
EISWNDLSNAAEFAQFRVRMSKLFPSKVGLFRKLEFTLGLGEKRKEKGKQERSRFVEIRLWFSSGVIPT